MARPKRQRPKEPTIEVILPEESDQAKTQVREVKHKTEWVELQPVEEAESPVEDEPEYEEIDVDGNPKPRKKNERDELRKALAKNNVTPGSNLRLSIERYLHSDAAEGGNWAETEFLTKYVCTKEHVTSEDYLDVARKWGPGTYRFTLRMNHSIVTAWDKRLGVPNTSSVVNTGDPAQPIFVNTPEAAAAAPIGVIDPRKVWKEHIESEKAWLELEKLKREAYGLNGGTMAAAPTDPKIAALQLISENPDVMEKIGSGIAKTVLGAKAGDSDPWADVAMEAVRSGQAVGIVREAINAFFSGVSGLFPKGNQNGQAQMGAPPVQAPTPQATPAVAWNQAPPVAEGAPARPVQEGARADQTIQQQVIMNPADELIIKLINAMERNAPLKEAQSIIEVAIFRNPELSESVDELLNMSIDSIMTLLGAYHPKVSEIPHAKEWLEKLIDSLAPGEGEEK